MYVIWVAEEIAFSHRANNSTFERPAPPLCGFVVFTWILLILQNQILCDLHFADVALMECSDFMQQLRSFKPQSLGCAVARRKSSTTLIFPLPPQACSGTYHIYVLLLPSLSSSSSSSWLLSSKSVRWWHPSEKWGERIKLLIGVRVGTFILLFQGPGNLWTHNIRPDRGYNNCGIIYDRVTFCLILILKKRTYLHHCHPGHPDSQDSTLMDSL